MFYSRANNDFEYEASSPVKPGRFSSAINRRIQTSVSLCTHGLLWRKEIQGAEDETVVDSLPSMHWALSSIPVVQKQIQGWGCSSVNSV